jgi:hypothetical protein
MSRGALSKGNKASLMKRSKYYIRVMRPTFQRAILTVEATSDEAAMRSALEQAEGMAESDWERFEAEQELPVIEVALSKDELDEDAGVDVLEFMTDVQHAYALLQANLETGEGAFIVPTWLRGQSALMVADVTSDWAEALAGISEEGVEAFHSWLAVQQRPANVVDFFAERDKRRGKPPQATE